MPTPAAPTGPKVFQLIRCLPSSEDRGIVEFLSSPQGGEAHAASARLVLLFQTVRKLTPEQVEEYGTADENIRRAIWKKLWPGKSASAFDTSYRRLLSDLMAAMERYLVWRQIQRDPLTWSLVLGAALKELNPSEGLAQFVFNQLRSEVTDAPQTVESKWFDVRLREMAFVTQSRHLPRQYSPEMEEIGNEFGQYSFARALKLYCALRAYNQILGKAEMPPLLLAIRQMATQNAAHLDELGRLYLGAADLQDAEAVSVEQIRDFVAQLDQTREGMDGAELLGLFRIAINCAAIAERSDRSFAGLLSEIYAVLMAHPLAAKPALQNPAMMSQFLRLSLKARDGSLEGMATQLREFIARLPQADRATFGPFLEALFSYHQGEFQAAFDQLGKAMAESHSPFVRLVSLKYKVRILFDAEEVLLTETEHAPRTGPKSAKGNSYVSIDLVLERYRKASDYGDGLSSEIMTYHQQFYRLLRALNHHRFGDPLQANTHLEQLRQAFQNSPETEDYLWLKGKVG
jgi:hypothetical protein